MDSFKDIPMTVHMLINEKEASKMLGVSIQTLRNDRVRDDRRKFPFIKLGKSVRYDIYDLNRIIEKNRVAEAEKEVEDDPCHL